MALDENKRPIICSHPSFKEVKGKEWRWECEECGLRFVNLPRKVSRRKRDARRSRIRSVDGSEPSSG